MSIGCSLRHEQRLEQRVEQRLTLEQRLQLETHVFGLRLQLIGALREERYEPRATCPKCGRQLTAIEIVKGFNQDPNDFTTGCTGCGHRFPPSLICFGKGSKIEIPFYCDAQALHQLRDKGKFSPEQLAQKHPAIYRSAIVHHGGIRKAFEKIGINYQHEETSDWKNKIKAFLGRMPDTIIADCVDISVNAIRRIRRKLGIERFTNKTILETIN